VIDIRMSGLIAPSEAVKSFAVLAGPVINGYAFCDRARQYATNVKAIEWTEQNPYRVLFMSQLTAKNPRREPEEVDRRAEDLRGARGRPV
jgi:hypothetical protein